MVTYALGGIMHMVTYALGGIMHGDICLGWHHAHGMT